MMTAPPGEPKADEPLLLLPAPRPLLLLPAPREEPPPPGRSRAAVLIREIVETGMLALIVFLCIRASIGNYQVEGHSMDPTLRDGELLLVSRLSYAELNTHNLAKVIPFLDEGSGRAEMLGGPGRGDIIILRNPEEPTGKRLVKRIIALPGEVMSIQNGHVFIDGAQLSEPYIPEVWHGAMPPTVCPARTYFVLGDNRDFSSDSRVFGCVPRADIIGKAVFGLWPLDRFGLMD